MPQKNASSKPALLVGGLILLLALAGGGYYFLTQSPQGTALMQQTGLPGVGMPKVSEKDFAFVNDPLIRKHMVAQANTTTYRVKTISSGKGGYTIMEIAMSSPTDIAFRTIDHNGTKEVSDMITIGDYSYLKDYSDNKWWKQGANQPESSTEPEMTGEPEDKKEVETLVEEYTEKQQASYKSLGEEPCGSLTCHKYEETMAENPEATRTFWFDTQKLLLRKEQLGFGEFLTTNEYDYEGVSVKEPSPTKDVPEGKSIYDYMMFDDSMLRDTVPGPDSMDYKLNFEEQSAPAEEAPAEEYSE